MELDNLIFDRTQADVDRAKYLAGLWVNGTFTGTTAELAEWATDLKGAYNATDLNRVIAAMDYLNEYFLGLGYDVGYTKIAVPHQPGGGGGILPSGYTQLEYIQSSGTQYIDTGFKAHFADRVEMVAEYLAIPPATVVPFGSISTSGINTRLNVTVAMNEGSYTERWKNVTGPYQAYFPASLSIVGKHTIIKEGNICTIDDISANTEQSNFESSYNMFLFCRNGMGTPEYMSSMRLYSCKIYDVSDNKMVRNYFPCKNSSNTIGLYDIINNQFYSNAGSGTFVAGPEAEPAQPSKDLYTWYEDDIPTQNEMSIYIEDVSRLRDKIPLLADTPETPDDMQLLTYQEANDIERILDNIERVLIAMENGFLLRQANTLFMIAGGVFNNA